MQRQYRLRREADIAQLRRRGQRWHHPLAILLVTTNNEDTSRFGFVASRRVGQAVARNRAKRLLREAVRLHLERIEHGWDCLFIARQAAATAVFTDVEAAVLQLLGRARLLREGAVS